VPAFVGRSGELEALAEVAARSSAGPAAALVVGKPGSGKSRLLAEARGRTELPRSFSVVGYEAERHVPLAAAAGLLRTLAEVPEHGPHLEALLFRPHDATGLEPVRVFEAALRAFRALEPALLVVDDLHWVDELSLALCHYLIRAAQDSGERVAVFAATRPGGSGISLTDPLPPERVALIELTALSREDGIELLVAIDTNLDRGAAAELWEKAQGSPFWLEALARAGGTAAGLGQFLTSRLRGAGSDAGTLLGLLAVVGRPISMADVAALADWPSERLQAALGQLVDRGLAAEAGGTPRLTHDLIREAAVAELPEDWLRRVHRRLAERLELEAGTDLRLLREALEHRRAAGMPTLDLATRLARSQHRTLLGQEGLSLLAGIADEAVMLDAQALALHEDVASLATELAVHEVALARWSLVAERAEAPLRRASALLAASKAAFELERGAESREMLARSRRVDVGDEILDLEQRTHEAAILLWLEQRTADGRALAHQAVAAATRLAARFGGAGADEGRARRAYLEALRLDYEAAVQEDDRDALLRAAEARESAARGLGLDAYLPALLSVGGALHQSGRVPEAITRFRGAWDETHRHVLPRLSVEAGYWLARSLQVVGELVEAERVVRETSSLAARAGDVPRARHRVARVESSIALERGQPWTALERLEGETGAESSEHQRIAFHQDLALWNSRLKGRGAAAVVREQVAAANACAEVAGCPRCGAELLLVSAEALARIGERAAARRMLARWDSRGFHSDEFDALLRSHAGALAERELETGAARLDATLAAAEESVYQLESLWVRLDLGLALAQTGSDRAVGELERAAAIASELGAGTVQDLSEKALRSLGVRTWRRGRVGGPLTGREQEVARLVVEGATNSEIAKVLFLSPKTVERHVSNILKKVGARNRTELASRLRDGEAKHAGNPR
jgi:DNA-binding CsgD family transcriptional regulator